MSPETFLKTINPFLEAHWEEIIQEAERRCASNAPVDPKAREYVEKLKVHAQTILVGRLENLKGDWLSFAEMEYALDLFNAQCETFEYFDILQNRGFLGVLIEEPSRDLSAE